MSSTIQNSQDDQIGKDSSDREEDAMSDDDRKEVVDMKNLFDDSDDDGDDADDNDSSDEENDHSTNEHQDDQSQIDENRMLILGILTLLGFVTVELVDEPDILSSEIQQDKDIVKFWYDFHTSDDIEHWKQSLDTWVLRIRMDRIDYSIKNMLHYYGLPTRQIDLSVWIQLVLSSCKEGFDKSIMHSIHNDDDADPEYHCVRTRIVKSGDNDCSKEILQRLQKKLNGNAERLICQVSAFVWSLNLQWNEQLDQYQDTISRGDVTVNPFKFQFDPSPVFSIDWEKIDTRLDVHPSEAQCTHVVSSCGNLVFHLDHLFPLHSFYPTSRWSTAKYSHSSVLHAICFEFLSHPFTIPVSSLTKLLAAHPQALRMTSDTATKTLPPLKMMKYLPLHYALERMSLGRSDWSVDHIKVLLEAYPESSSVECITEHISRDRDPETHLSRLYPIEILCSYAGSARFTRACKFRGVGVSGMFCSHYEDLNEQRLETIEQCIQVLLDTMDASLLTKIRTDPDDSNWYGHPLQNLCRAYDKRWRSYDVDTELDSLLNESILRTYMMVLRATWAAPRKLTDVLSGDQGRDEEELLHVSLRPEHGGVYDIHRILPQILNVIHPSALRNFNQEGLLPLHVAIENTTSINRKGPYVQTSLSMCIDALIDASPTCIFAKERRNNLYPFMLAAVGENAKLDVIYHILRKEPTLLSHACSAPICAETIGDRKRKIDKL